MIHRERYTYKVEKTHVQVTNVEGLQTRALLKTMLDCGVPQDTGVFPILSPALHELVLRWRSVWGLLGAPLV